MSTAILETPDWLSEPLIQSSASPIQQLISVTWGQLAEAELSVNGWWQLACLDCGELSEPFEGSLTAFAELQDELGWSVSSVERNHAICFKCVSKEDDGDYAEQYRSGSGGLL